MIVTEFRKITFTPALRTPVKVKFLTRRGTIDEVLFTRFKDWDMKTKPSLYGSNNTEKVYEVNSTSTTTYYSTWYTENELEWMKDLMLSPHVTVDGKYVKVNGSTYSFDNEKRLFAVELEVSPLYEENKITL